MGTRGYWGFKKDGEMKMTICHFDSYIEGGLGEKVLNFVKNYSIKELNEIFKNIEMVSPDSIPTKQQIEEIEGFEDEACKKVIDTTVGDCSKYSWYCLLRGAQINPELYAEGLKYMSESVEYKDEDYHYIIDLDTNELKMYCRSNSLIDCFEISDKLDTTPDVDEKIPADYDFIGNEIKVGDKVVGMLLNYRSFVIYKILKITDKKVKLEIIDCPENIFSRSHIGKIIYQSHDQIVKL